MAKQRNALRAGIFMIVSVALIIFVVIAISGAARFTQKFNTYVVSFGLGDDVGGLRVGDDVRIGGVKVGSVRDIQIHAISPDANTTSKTQVLVYIELPARYNVAKNANIMLKKELTGSPSLNFDDLGSGDILPDNGRLTGQPDAFSTFMTKLGTMALALQQTVTNLKTASAKVNDDLDKVGSTVDDVHTRIPKAVDHYHEVASSAVKMLNTLTDWFGPSTGDFHTTVANLRSVTGSAKEKLPGLLDQLHDTLQKSNEAVKRASAAMVDVQATLANTRDLTGGARDLVMNNKSRFTAIIGSLRTTSDNLKYASAEIRHSPWRLLYQPKASEVSNMNIYDSMRQFAEGANNLDDAAGALRDAVKDKNVSPADMKKLMDHLNDSFSHFQEVQQKMWNDVKQ